MSVNDTYNITSVFHDLHNGLTSSTIPNWITILIEVIIGFGLALVFLHLQRKTEGALLKDIKEYTDDMRKHDNTRKKFYIKRIKEILGYIKNQDNWLKGIITDFNEDPNQKNPTPVFLVSLEERRDKIERMCLNAETYLSFLEPLLTEPQRAEEIMKFLPDLYEPFKYLTKEPLWKPNTHIVDLSNQTLEEHLPAIKKYLELLSKEEEAIGVTKSPN